MSKRWCPESGGGGRWATAEEWAVPDAGGGAPRRLPRAVSKHSGGKGRDASGSRRHSRHVPRLWGGKGRAMSGKVQGVLQRSPVLCTKALYFISLAL